MHGRSTTCLFLLLAYIVCTACGSEDAPDSGNGAYCGPLALRDCFCANGDQGLEQCDFSGYWGACVCGNDVPDVTSDIADATDTVDEVSDAVVDSAPQDSTDAQNETGHCFDPLVDCVGELPDSVCENHTLTRYQWTCGDSLLCEQSDVQAACHFGCAPPNRGAACARLAFSTAADETGDLCIVTSLADEAPTCLDEPGYGVQWHPSMANRVAYTTMGPSPWVEIADLGDGDVSCQAREFGRDPPPFSAGGWGRSNSDELLVFKGVFNEGFSLQPWTVSLDEEMCLVETPERCIYSSGDEFPLEGAFTILGDVSPDRGAIAFLQYPIEGEVASLSVNLLSEGCDGDLLLEREGVQTAGWLSSGALRYVANGSLYHYQIGESDPVVMVDSELDDWSRGLLAVVDFNFDASILAAVSTDGADTALYFFARDDEGTVTPWPAAEANSIAGPILWPAFERFGSDE